MQRAKPFCFAVALLACGSDPAKTDTGANNWPEATSGPAGTGPGVRVFSGTAATLSGGTSCTTEAGAEGDRWCIFIGLSGEGEQNLFVVNVSQITAGTPVTCDAPDPNCLLLTPKIGGSAADWHPTVFAGDTLVYYDHLLTAYVWRPGMEAGRVLASRDGTNDIAFCTPAPRGTTVACLSIPFEQPDGELVAAELLAGAADSENEPPLTRIDSVIAGTWADSAKVHRFAFASPAPGYIAWSSRQTAEGPEILKVQHVDDPASQLTVATDVHEWNLSADGSAWLWLSAANELGIGTLQTALFPDGAYPTDVLFNVREYGLTRDGSLVSRTLDNEAISVPDPIGAPHEHVWLDSDVGKLVTLSDQGDVAYVKSTENGAITDLRVSSLDGARSCVLEPSANFSQKAIHFAPGSGTVLWARANTEGYDAYHSRLEDCSSVTLSPNVVVLGWIGSAHAIFIDDFDADSASGSLRYRRIGRDGTLHPEPATLIAEHVDTYATWGPDILLYTINAGSDADGAYVRAF
jgi:hypothetical protein